MKSFLIFCLALAVGGCSNVAPNRSESPSTDPLSNASKGPSGVVSSFWKSALAGDELLEAVRRTGSNRAQGRCETEFKTRSGESNQAFWNGRKDGTE